MVPAFLLVLGCAVSVAAQDAHRPKAAPQEVTEAFGGKQGWGKIPEWRQREILRAWKRFEKLPESRKREIRGRGLEGFLVRPTKRFRLPPELKAEVDKLPKTIRPQVQKFAELLLHTLRLDRHLSLIPFQRRRPLFNRMFPRPFEQQVAKKARKELEREVSRAMARRLLVTVKTQEVALGRSLTREEKMKLVHASARKEEQKIHGRVRREIRRFRGGKSPRDAGRMMASGGYHLIERHPLMRSPRQRELIRYAFRPERCPLIRIRFMGERPKDRVERRLWDHDFRVLARIELLSDDFPPEMVLHLAAASSPADFFRAVKAFSGRSR